MVLGIVDKVFLDHCTFDYKFCQSFNSWGTPLYKGAINCLFIPSILKYFKMENINKQDKAILFGSILHKDLKLCHCFIVIV